MSIAGLHYQDGMVVMNDVEMSRHVWALPGTRSRCRSKRAAPPIRHLHWVEKCIAAQVHDGALARWRLHVPALRWPESAWRRRTPVRFRRTPCELLFSLKCDEAPRRPLSTGTSAISAGGPSTPQLNCAHPGRRSIGSIYPLNWPSRVGG